MSDLEAQKKRIRYAVSAGMLLEVLNKIFPILLIRFVHSRVGTENFGIAQFAISVIELTIPFVLFGYDQSCAIQLNKLGRTDQEAKSQLFSSVVVLRVGGAVLTSLGLIALAFHSNVFGDQSLFIPMFVLFTMICALDSSWVLIAFQKTAKLNFIVGIAKTISFALIFICITGPKDIVWYTFLICSTNAAVNIITFQQALKSITFQRPAKHILHSTFKKSLPFALIAILMIIIQRIDIVSVQILFSKYELGIYSGFSRMNHSFYGLIHALAIVFFSEQVASKSIEEITKVYHYSLFMLCLFIAPIAMGIWLVDQPLTSLILGSEFAQHSTILSILVFSHVGSASIILFGGQILIPQRETKNLSICLLIGIGCFLLGAHWSQLIQSISDLALLFAAIKILIGGLCCYHARKYLKSLVNRSILGLLLMACLSILIPIVLGLQNFIWIITSSALTYVVLIICFFGKHLKIKGINL